MATLIPSFSQCDFETSGEKRLAERLRQKLGDEYLVWFDVPVGRRKLFPDFVILHPQQGLFVLEVKDWKLDTITYATHDRFTIYEGSESTTTRNPLRQARQNAHAAVDLLRQDKFLVHQTGPYQGNLIFPYTYGVVLLNITRRQFESKDAFGSVIDPSQVICKDEMTESVDPWDFQNRLQGMHKYQFGAMLTPEQIDRMRWHLYPEMRIAEPVEDVNVAAWETIKVMDIEQEKLARSLKEGHRVIHGVSGSGKTLILAYRCEYLAEQEGFDSILVLCFNVALASKLRAMMVAKGITHLVTVIHFHDWCKTLVRDNSLPLPNNGAPIYEQRVDAVIKAVEDGRLPTGLYDAILVDEGHDFEREWFELTAKMVNPETESLLVLYDDAQKLYKRTNNQLGFYFKGVGIKAQGRTKVLRINYRNTLEILSFAYTFAKEVMLPSTPSDEDTPPLIEPRSSQRRGILPEVVRHRSFDGEVDYIITRARQLHAQGIPWNEMAILYLADWVGEKVYNQLVQEGLPVYWVNENLDSRNFNPAEQSIKLMTMKSSKGLEFLAVFVTAVITPRGDDEVTGSKMLYVAMTRAIEHLIVGYSRASSFSKRLEDSLKEVRTTLPPR